MAAKKSTRMKSKKTAVRAKARRKSTARSSKASPGRLKGDPFILPG